MKKPGRGSRKEPQLMSDDSYEDDDFDFDDIGKPQKVAPSKWKRLVLILLLLVMLGGVGWWYLIGANQMTDEANLPVIRAEVGPIKVKPENPGGMEIPNRDKLVYERLGSKPGEPLVERLLPEPEKPVAMPAPEPEPEKAPVVVEKVMPKAVEEAPKPAPMKLEPAPVEVTKAPEPKVVAPKPVVVTKPAIKPVASGKYKIQLASVRSEAAAAGEWKRLSKRNSDLLGKLSMSLMKADLGDKGIFYRLRAGPLPDEAAAKKLCADLSAKKIGCLVVRP
ncbi:MAG: SPOR domain-containing protein [Rhodospirillales bacterium]|nr:SPOR domain-containing protein [Rhodospirillales bacterium]